MLNSNNMTSNVGSFLPNIHKKNQVLKEALQEKKVVQAAKQSRPFHPVPPVRRVVAKKIIRSADEEISPETHRRNAADVSKLMASFIIIKKAADSQK